MKILLCYRIQSMFGTDAAEAIFHREYVNVPSLVGGAAAAAAVHLL